MKSWDQFPVSTRWICGDEGFRDQLRSNGLDSLAALSGPCVGEFVTSSRSSWVRRWSVGTTSFYIKTYDYPTWRDRSRGIGRTTLFARSRAHRELQALKWLRDHGFGGPAVRAVVEGRVLGWLARAVLVTEAWPGEPVDEVLGQLEGEGASAVLAAVREFVDRLHAAGFRDRNLDLRNLLARRSDDGWEVVKIDSPRFRLRPGGAGARSDDLARADWTRLEESVRAAGLTLRDRAS